MSDRPARGRLTLVATPIGNLGDLAPRAVLVLRSADVLACEDTRHTRKLLTHAGISAGNRLVAMHDHNEASAAERLLALLEAGRHVAVVTDAGTPGISDPGERLVRLAATAGIDIDTVPGPSAAVAALVVSGLPTGRFCVEGFLPRKGRERAERLADVAVERRTVVLYESPSRVAATLADLVARCGPDRRVALCRELTKLHEEVWRGSLGEAVAQVGAVEPRGEYVMVIEGAPPPAAAEAEDVVASLTRRLAAGESKKSAVAAVAADLGVPRRQVYEAALRLSPPIGSRETTNGR